MNQSKLPSYTAVIRTLGTAGEKYQCLLNSLNTQLHKPTEIIVYLAEGYERPKETIGWEKIVYVKKGMVSQRALNYNEVKTEWVLFLDDDLSIESDGVERLFESIFEYDADGVACDTFPHHTLPLKTKITMALLGSSIPRIWNKRKGYTVSVIGGDIYNPRPGKVGISTTNAGPAFLCRKSDFLKLNFEEELWLDDSPYALPDDKVMFFKMSTIGLKIMTHYDSGFKHLDGRSSITEGRERKIVYSATRNTIIFFRHYVYPTLTPGERIIYHILRPYCHIMNRIYIYFKFKGKDPYREEREKGKRDAKQFLKSIHK